MTDMLEVISLDKEKPDFYELDISIRMQTPVAAACGTPSASACINYF